MKKYSLSFTIEVINEEGEVVDYNETTIYYLPIETYDYLKQFFKDYISMKNEKEE